MPTTRIAVHLNQETYEGLSASAVRELRPIPWHIVVLLRRSLGLPSPRPEETEEVQTPRRGGKSCVDPNHT